MNPCLKCVPISTNRSYFSTIVVLLGAPVGSRSAYRGKLDGMKRELQSRLPNLGLKHGHERGCGCCGKAGDLLQCSKCPVAYHPQCAGYGAPPLPCQVFPHWPVAALSPVSELKACEHSGEILAYDRLCRILLGVRQGIMPHPNSHLPISDPAVASLPCCACY